MRFNLTNKRPNNIEPGLMRQPMRVQASKGFTLIELLVVISIIGLLIAILLPTLAMAKGSASAIQCGSNMKQLGIANGAYAVDNSDVFAPFRENAGAPDAGDYWDVLLADYFNRAMDNATPVFDDDAAGGGAALQCPDDEYPYGSVTTLLMFGARQGSCALGHLRLHHEG